MPTPEHETPLHASLFRTKIHVMGSLGVLVAVLTASLAAQEVLTLDRAIELVLQNNRPVASSGLEVRKFDERIASLRTERLPRLNWYAMGGQLLTRLNFRFDRGVFGTYPGIGPVPAVDTGIQAGLKPTALLFGRIDQPLFQQYRIGLGLAGLRLARDVALQQQRAQRQGVVADIRGAYYGILQAQSALESVRESIRLTEQAALLKDVLLLQTALAEANDQYQKALLAFWTARADFEKALGGDLP